MVIRVYAGDYIQDIDLTGRSSLTIGSGRKCTVRLDESLLKGAEVKLIKAQRQWVAHCKGDVHGPNGEIRSIVLTADIILVLNEDTRVALEVMEPGQDHIAVPLDSVTALTIGRKSDRNLWLQNARVSSNHADLVKRGNRWVLIDHSANGTFVNKRQIAETVLTDKDRIDIADFTMTLENDTLHVTGARNKVVVTLPDTPRVPKPLKQSEPPAPSSMRLSPFQRSPRTLTKRKPIEITIQNAPGIGSMPETNWISVFLPTVLMALVYGLYAYIQKSGSMLVMLPMMSMGAIISVVNFLGQKKRYRQREALRHEKYQQYIETVTAQMEAANKKQRDEMQKENPTPVESFAIVAGQKRALWGKRPQDSDFLSLRVGHGTTRSDLQIRIPQEQLSLEEDIYNRIPRQLKEAYSTVSDVPVRCDLRTYSSCGITGPRRQMITLVQNMLLQMTALHCYEEVRLAVFFPKQEGAQWNWMRWLPHCFDETRSVRYLACTDADAEYICAVLEDRLKERVKTAEEARPSEKDIPLPFYLFVIADADILQNRKMQALLQTNDKRIGVSSLWLGEDLAQLPLSVEWLIQLDDQGNGEMYPRDDKDHTVVFALDPPPENDCEEFARAMAPVRVPAKTDEYTLPGSITFLEGMHAAAPKDLRIAERWQRPHDPHSLAVPIGVKENGETFLFDIHEKKHGPHGLVAGMTGSGKSEMIQSWILSMAVQYSPQQVSFVLIDFKGTGLIQPFMSLPHLAGTISNLDSNITRNLIALESELIRRQTLFDAAHVTSIEQYHARYQEGLINEPLSYLFVVIDEYAEFKEKYPEFTKAIDSLFRTARSLGLRAILLTQNPTNVVSSESAANVRFRWCLKVANTAASKEMIGRPDAARLTVPGRAFIKIGEDEEFVLLQSFWSGAPYRARDMAKDNDIAVSVVDLQARRIRYAANNGKKATDGAGDTEIMRVVQEIARTAQTMGGVQARQLWQPRLQQQIFLEDLCGEAVPAAGLSPILGMVDDPYRQSQDVLRLPLAQNHFAVLGAPGSGKTTLLQTLTTSLCMQYAPAEVNVCILDFGGGTFRAFEKFPHVVCVAAGGQEETIRAAIQWLEDTAAQRKTQFADHGGSIQAYRQSTGQVCPYLVVVIDNFPSLLQTYPDYEEFFRLAAQDYGRYGISLALAANSTTLLGYRIKSSIKIMVALNMTDRADYSDIVGRTEGLEPEDVKGRGLCVQSGRVLEFQTALPCRAEDAGRMQQLRALGARLQLQWKGLCAPKVRSMPRTVSRADLAGVRFGIGLAYDGLAPVAAFEDGAHIFVVSADAAYQAELIHMLAADAFSAGKEVAVYGAGALSGVTALDTIDEFNCYIRTLAKRLDDRRRGEGSDDVDIYILIANWGECFDGMADDIPALLGMIANYAQRVGVWLAVCAERRDIIRLENGHDPATRAFLKGNVLAAAGAVAEYTFLETSALSLAERNAKIAVGDGWLFGKGQPKKIKLLYKEGNCETK